MESGRGVLIGASTLLIAEYELTTFINFSYYGMIPLFLIGILPNFNRFKIWQATLLAFSLVIISVSKAFFIVYTPLFLIRTMYSLQKRQWKDALLFAAPLLGIAMTVYMLSLSVGDAQQQKQTLSLASILVSTLKYWAVLISQSLVGKVFYLPAVSHLHQKIIILVSAFVSLGLFYRVLFKNCDKKRVFILAAGFLVAGATAGLKVLYDSVPEPEYLFAQTSHTLGRQWFAGMSALLLAFGVTFQEILPTSPWKKGLLFLTWLSVNTHALLNFRPAKPSFPTEGYSNWSAFTPVFQRPATDGQCIPVNPYPWIYTRHCDYLTPPPPWEDLKNSTSKQAIEFGKFKLPTEAHGKKILTVGLALETPGCEQFTLEAYDANDQLIADGKILLSQGNRKFAFFLFENLAANATSFQLKSNSSNGKDCSTTSTFLWNDKLNSPHAVWMGQG
jgi:hypothetical protein